MVGNQRRRLKQFIIINNNYLLYRGNICTYIHIHVCMFIYIYIYIYTIRIKKGNLRKENLNRNF